MRIPAVSSPLLITWASFAAAIYSPWYIALAIAGLGWHALESAIAKKHKIKEELDAKVKVQNDAMKEMQSAIAALVAANEHVHSQVKMLTTAKSMTPHHNRLGRPIA